MAPRKLTLVLLGLVACAVPLVGSTYGSVIGARILIYGILAMSLDLILGYGGMVSLGHAAYFGTGAYTVGVLALYGVTSGFVAFPAAIAAAAVAALVIGTLSLRTRGFYFIMLTLAFAQMLFYLAVGQQQLGGDDGMPSPHRDVFAGPVNLASPEQFYYFALVLLALTTYLAHRLVHSRFGLILNACRQNETRLLTVGISTYRYKLVAFVIAGAIAGLAGALIANLEAYISPNFLDWKVSGDVIIMIVMGGIGTLLGPIFGAALYIVMEEIVTPFTAHWMAILGPLLVLVALFWRRGVWGLLGTALAPARSRDTKKANARPSSSGSPRTALKWKSAEVAAVEAAARLQGGTRAVTANTVPILSVRGLEKRFGGIVATDSLDFDVMPGELHGLIGPNGAGKTTFIAQLAGLLTPDAGSIALCGTDITRLNPPRRAALGLARSFQITSIFPDFTALENVLVAVAAKTGHCFRFWRPVHSDVELTRRALVLLESVGLVDARDKTARILAHGERRLLDLAIALATEPRLLLLDEPMAGMGTRESAEVEQLLHRLRRRYAMVLIEHDMDAVFRLCDRISVMAGGRLIASGSPGEIGGNPEVKVAYLGED